MAFLSKLKLPNELTTNQTSSFTREKFQRTFNLQPDGSTYPISESTIFKSGTAGFRYRANLLPYVVYRLGFGFAALFDACPPAAYGVVFTASHNPADDNGVKIVYRNGLSLHKNHVEYIEYVVNLSDANFERIYHSEGISDDDEMKIEERKLLKAANYASLEEMPQIPVTDRKNIIILARDTRQSGHYLQQVFQFGFERRNYSNVEFLDAGFMPTATHHYVVANFYNSADPLSALLDYGFDSKSETTIHVDCTNGVGSLWVEDYFKKCTNVKIKLFNDDYKNFKVLNHKCGADYVQGSRQIPEGIPYDTLPAYTRIYHLDGDCDRMVISFMDENKEFHIFDGDHLIMLFTTFIQRVLPDNDKFSIGIVYTSYANGGFSKWLSNSSSTSSCLMPLKAGTGVAKLIKASEAADMAIYFEPNGHGSIIIKPEHENEIMKTPLAPLLKLVNTAIGDGIANIRAVEYMLNELGWTTQDWMLNTFTRFPTKLLKIPVANPLNYASTPDNEEILLRPKHLQTFLESTLSNFSSKYGKCHAFMRPSGTENYMRVKVDMDSNNPDALELLSNVLTDAVKLNEDIVNKPVSNQ